MRYPFAILLAGLLAATAAPQTTKDTPPATLVKQLGSRKFAERDAATAALDALGAAALPALEQGRKDTDPEVRSRAEKLRDRIQGRLESARLLAGKRVRLQFKDTPVADAIDELARRTGFPIRFDGDRDDLVGRTVTLDTGDTTFWEALAQFCGKAGLVERPVPVLHSMPGMKRPTMTIPGTDRQAPVPRDLVLLADGQPKAVPTCFAGAVRLQALPATYPHQKGETAFLLAVAPEPNMPWQYAERMTITKAVDDRGQSVAQPEPYVLDRKWIFGMDGPTAWDAGTGDKYADPAVDLRSLLVRLTCGKLPSQRLQEVQGVLSVRLMAVRPVLTVDDVLKSAGKTVPAARGGELQVVAVQAKGDQVEVNVRLRGFPVVGARGQVLKGVRVKKGFVALDGVSSSRLTPLALLDGAGREWTRGKVEEELHPDENGGLVRDLRVVFQRPEGATAAARLTYSAPSPTVVDVPFTLRDVPLVAAK